MQECRPKSSSRNGSVATSSQVIKKSEKARDKSSVSSESDVSANGGKCLFDLRLLSVMCLVL